MSTATPPPTSSDPPLWLLDVDGVVNAIIRGTRPDTWPHDSWHKRSVLARIAGGRFPIWYSDRLVAFINETHESGRAEVRWLTTWEHDALGLGDALGLRTFKVEAATENEPHSDLDHWWKLLIMQRLQAENVERRMVWTDDDIDYERNAKVWILSQPPGRLLAVCPRAAEGLTPEHCKLITEFLTPGS